MAECRPWSASSSPRRLNMTVDGRSRRMSRRCNRLRRWRPVDHVMGWRPSKRPIYRRRSSSVHTGWTMRRCGSMSTHRAAAPPPSLLTLNDSQHTRSSLSRTYAAGRSRASALCYLSNEPRYSVSRRPESLRSPWGFAMGLRHLRHGLLRVTGRWLPTACHDAGLASACVPRRRQAGAVLPEERDPVGGRAARCSRRRCHDRAVRVARRRVLERRAPADGGVGVWTLSIAMAGRSHALARCRRHVRQAAH
jgi:hypothetical protein